tara:strand:+ start:7032 stop:7784 length:753 start_codon:yes stop_codon:yes gene_type:complete
VLKSKKLSKFNKINHFFFNRNGGVSKGIYSTLNCGLGSNDNKANILKNLSIVSRKIKIKKKNLVFLNQIHSSKFFILKKLTKKKLIGDGLITARNKIGLCILTADCAPILIYDKKKNIICAAHAGWRGAFKKIIIKILKRLIKLGSKKNDLIVAIGPCISQKNYEVGREFKYNFILKNHKNKKFFKSKNKRIYFNLSGFIENQLIEYGIKKIDIIKKDTFYKKNNFFSSRRAIKNNENDYGRNLSVIMIK